MAICCFLRKKRKTNYMQICNSMSETIKQITLQFGDAVYQDINKFSALFDYLSSNLLNE